MAKRRNRAVGVAPPSDIHLLLCGPFKLERWRSVLALDCHVRVGNLPVAIGREKAISMLAAFVDRIRAIGTNFWDVGRVNVTTYIETDLQRIVERNTVAEMPCVIVIRCADGLIQDLRVYVDRIAEAGTLLRGSVRS